MSLTSSTLASLRFFAEAARLQSFKRAAVKLHVTQGAVSQQIKQLEEALGCKLFYRLPRQVQLTDQGKQFAAVVERALADLEQAARSLAGSPAEIRLRVAPSLALRWLVPRLGEWYARFPNIRVFVMGAYGYFDPAQRDFDLAIEMMRGQIPALRCEELMDEDLTPVCTPEYLQKHPFLKKPSDLSRCELLHDGHAWAVEEGPDAEWRFWLQEVGAATVDSRQGQYFSLSNMSIEAALSHQGIAMGRRALVGDLIADGKLVAPFRQRIKSPYRYCLLYPKELGEQPALQAIIGWLKSQVQRPNVP